MKKFFSLTLAMFCFLAISIAQDFRIVDDTPPPLAEYQHTSTDTMPADILYGTEMVKGFYTRKNFTCVYDRVHQMEGKVFSRNVGVYDQDMKPLDVELVLALRDKDLGYSLKQVIHHPPGWNMTPNVQAMKLPYHYNTADLILDTDSSRIGKYHPNLIRQE